MPRAKQAGLVIAVAWAIQGWGVPAAAASLRDSTILSGPDVRLSDLFDDAGEQAARVLGSGPPPGERLVIKAPQLDAIARQFDVDWRSSSSADHTVLERPGRPVPRDLVLAALHAALASGYTLPGQLDIELPGFAPPMMPLGGTPEVMIESLDSDPASGHFTAQLSATAGPASGNGGHASEMVRFSVGGVARQLVTLPVLTHRLMPGEIIGPEDLQFAGVPVNIVQAAVVRAPAEAVGQSARRPLLPGQPIVLADLGPPVLVRRGGTVMLVLDVGGLSVSAQGMALDSGGMGEHIHVLNTSSRAVVEAEITGPGHGRVLPGAISILAEGRTTLPPNAPNPADLGRTDLSRQP